MKKKLIIAIGIAIVAVIGGIIGYSQYNVSRYENNRKEFVAEANKSVGLYSVMCDGIREVWHGYIFESKKYYDPEDGTFLKGRTYRTGHDEIYCANFSDAIQKRMEWYESKITPEMQESYHKAIQLYKEMTPPPSKFEKTHQYIKQMYKATDQLKELAENPTGNYHEYSSKCGESLEEYTSALKDLEIEADL